MNPLLYSDRGIQFIPSLHDGLLLGLFIGSGREIEMRFLTQTKQELRMRIPDLLALKANNFRQGNIIFEVRIYNKKNCPPLLVQNAFGYDNSEWAKFGQTRLAEIESLDWHLMEVRESYGCEVHLLSGHGVNEWDMELVQNS